MKKLIYITLMALAISACKKDNTSSSGAFPENVAIDIPESLSSDSVQSTAKVSTNDTIKGGEIYAHLRTFIRIGEKSAEVINDIMQAIKKFELNKPMDFTFISNDDQRTKHCIVVENAVYLGKNYAFKLTITDSSHNAMQVFWNSSPVEGVAILDPYEINHKTLNLGVLYSLEYGEGTLAAYDKHMIVSITGWPAIGVYGLNNLKMFVGKKNSMLDIYGNSNHPNASIFIYPNPDGFSYSFTAHADQANNIAVVNLALPGTSLSSADSIFINYSITKVFENEMHTIWDKTANGDPVKLAFIKAAIDKLLLSTQIPGYFSAGGYIGCGTTKPDGFTDDFVNISDLTPYIPNDVKKLKIQFAD